MRNPDRIPLDWFACPVTKAPLTPIGNELVSDAGRYRFNSDFGYWDFIPQGRGVLDLPEWSTWTLLQDNGVVSYKADPEHNLGVGKRQDFLDFAEFSNFHGTVLDVGVGPQRCPTHIEYCTKKDVFFVGIDPLVGDQPRCFTFVRGLGEYLPFRERLFDQVLFVTSLDHFIDARKPLFEARRVLRDEGEICVWIGEKAKNAPKPVVQNEWYEALTIPNGADDQFHYKRFTSGDFESYVAESGLAIRDKKTIAVTPWKSNLFYRLQHSG